MSEVLYYWSASKKKYVPVAEMATPHLRNAIRKMEGADTDTHGGLQAPDTLPIEQLVDCGKNLTVAELLPLMRVELERREAQQEGA